MIPHDDLTDESFLALHGFEVEVNEDGEQPWDMRKCCHICFIGLEPDNITQPCWHRSAYLFGNAPKYRDMVRYDEKEPDYIRHYSSEGITDIMQTAREKGFFVTYNHPTWSKEDYSNYMGYKGMHAFEMFNGGCIVGGFDEYNPRVYDDILTGGQRIFCIGADDNHNFHSPDSRRFDSGYAYTMIKAERLDYRTVTKRLKTATFMRLKGRKFMRFGMRMKRYILNVPRLIVLVVCIKYERRKLFLARKICR